MFVTWYIAPNKQLGKLPLSPLHFYKISDIVWLGMVVHTFNSSILETEAGGRSGLQSEF